jgi:hypothetical protein
MLPEEKTDRLFNAVYKSGMLNVYDYCAEEWKNDEETFLSAKPWPMNWWVKNLPNTPMIKRPN